MSIYPRVTIVAFVASLAACSAPAVHPPTQMPPPFGVFWNQGFVHDELLDGPWRRVAVDSLDQMSVCRRLEGFGGSCVGDMLGGETVFAAGIDAKYVVYALHPREWTAPPDRNVSEFYYVVRNHIEGQAGGLGPDDVKGPFSEAQFATETKRLGLPTLSRVFEDLK